MHAIQKISEKQNCGPKQTYTMDSRALCKMWTETLAFYKVQFQIFKTQLCSNNANETVRASLSLAVVEDYLKP